MPDRRIAKTKAAIRTAFLNLLKNKPLEEITVTELAKEANLERKTFYLHYSNIREIVEEINGDVAEQIAQETKGLSPRDREYYARLTKIMDENFDYYGLIMKDSRYAIYQFEGQQVLRAALLEHYRETTDLEGEYLELYADFYAMGIGSIYLNWLQNGQKLGLEDLTDFVYRMAVSP